MTRRELYYGDNLDVLRETIPSESVDLVYLDPPFNSQADYNVIFKDQTGEQSGAQILAFGDTWKWGTESEQAIADMMTTHGRLASFLQDLVGFLNRDSLSAYLVMMTVRLVELHRVLRPDGSIYLHCDPTASHYLKVVMDIIFGVRNFRDEITWKRSSAHNDAKQGRKAYGSIVDVILYYTKSDNFTFNTQYTPYDEEYLEKFYRHIDENGRRYRLGDLTGPGGAAKGNPSYEVMGVTRYWRYSEEKMRQLIEEGRIVQTGPGNVPQYKRYLDEMPGVPLQNIWSDIPPVSPQARERLGYPTQKPVALLERIIAVSSNPGDVVLDPFCGCGTTISAAEKLGRQWTGIDITHLSIGLIKARLKRDFDLVVGKDYQEYGTPRELTAALYFAEQDPYQFQFWIVGEIGAQAFGSMGDSRKGKKGGDTGIDGQLFFRTPDGVKIERGIVSVKAGKNLNPGMVRDLRGTVEREKAAVGVLLLAHAPTRGMLDEAAKAGSYTWGGRTYPRLQILTVKEILEQGKQPDLPRGSVNVSYEQKKAKSLIGKKARDQGAAPLFN